MCGTSPNTPFSLIPPEGLRGAQRQSMNNQFTHFQDTRLVRVCVCGCGCVGVCVDACVCEVCERMSP